MPGVSDDLEEGGGDPDFTEIKKQNQC